MLRERWNSGDGPGAGGSTAPSLTQTSIGFVCHAVMSETLVSSVLASQRGGFTGGSKVPGLPSKWPVTAPPMPQEAEIHLRRLCVSNSSTGLCICRCSVYLLSEERIRQIEESTGKGAGVQGEVWKAPAPSCLVSVAGEVGAPKASLQRGADLPVWQWRPGVLSAQAAPAERNHRACACVEGPAQGAVGLQAQSDCLGKEEGRKGCSPQETGFESFPPGFFFFL